MHEDQRKHLELIQTVIVRLAGNSFTVKGWSVTLASALLALALKDFDCHLALLSLLPVSLFWIQDAYFLQQERLFRRLYEAVRHAAVAGQTDNPSLFSMNTNVHRANVGSLAWIVFSGSLLAFHGGLTTLIVIGIYVAGLHDTPAPVPGPPKIVAPAPLPNKTP